jgi:AmmeMemoRadiSam system protein B
VTGRPTALRPPAVAGTFYPSAPSALRAALDRSFDAAVPPSTDAPAPTAIVVPHAGYVYSGPVAASAYARLAPLRRTVRRVVLLGPSHRVPLRGLALSSAAGWESPLGVVPLDPGAASALAHLPFVTVDDRPHAPEHSLEVQLPFLQTALDELTLVPVVVGDATTDEVATVIDVLWTGPDTLVVVSTDLSHYLDHATATTVDARTAAAIVARRPEDIADRDACGARPLRGLLRTATSRDLRVELLDLRNSGDTAGDRSRVVGYGAFAVG